MNENSVSDVLWQISILVYDVPSPLPVLVMIIPDNDDIYQEQPNIMNNTNQTHRGFNGFIKRLESALALGFMFCIMRNIILPLEG